MQTETRTKIAIRGKGSLKEGIIKNPSYDYGEDEPLHVMITGDTKDDVRTQPEGRREGCSNALSLTEGVLHLMRVEACVAWHIAGGEGNGDD